MKSESTTAFTDPSVNTLVQRLVHKPRDRKRVLAAIEEKTRFGYTFTDADASLELLVLRLINGKKLPFYVASYHVSMRGSMEENPKASHVCEASIKVRVGGAEFFEVSEANGPVHALDGAIRNTLTKSRLPSLSSVRLTDYSVGLVNGITTGAAARTRVRIVTADMSTSWSTLGVSDNVIEASLLALIDSLEYAFFRMRARK